MTDAMANPNGPAYGPGHGLPHVADPMAIRCYGTGRYGTERKIHQDPDENPSVVDTSGAVDNGAFGSFRGAWHATTADEWFDTFIERLEANPQRKRRAISELYRPLPGHVLAARAYEAETEHQRALLNRALGREATHA